MLTASRFKSIYFIAMAFSLLCAFLSGCSISDSVGSISDSSGSIANSSESISDSSKSSSKDDDDKAKASAKGDDNRYERELKDYTVTYVRANSGTVDADRFMKGLSEIASDNAIVDWEANPKTYRAIGKGLRKSGVTGIRYDDYKRALADGDKGKMADIEEGYTD